MRFLQFVERFALRRSSVGGRGVYSSIAFAGFLLRQYDKRSRRNVVVLREELQPGESLLITHTTHTQG